MAPAKVQRLTATYAVEDITGFKQQMLNWVNRFNICCFLDNHRYQDTHNSVECLLGAGALSYIHADNNALPQLEAYMHQNNDWLFGHLNYDLKNEIEGLQSNHPDYIQFPALFFFQPEIVIELKDSSVIIRSALKEPLVVFEEIVELSAISNQQSEEREEARSKEQGRRSKEEEARIKDQETRNKEQEGRIKEQEARDKEEERNKEEDKNSKAQPTTNNQQSTNREQDKNSNIQPTTNNQQSTNREQDKNNEALPTSNDQLSTNQQLQTTNYKPQTNIRSRISKEEYINAIKTIQQHILRGDCYELNFCQEFFAEKTELNPVETYQRLTQISPNPFACYYKLDDKYLLCASPERYLKKTGDSILSQPIKGTFKRDTTNSTYDNELKEALYNSPKDRSENVMVVDLVRNDLSKICEEGSVKVNELFGIYSFPQVHQMISTIRGKLRPGLSFTDIIRSTFPMGSMTGAPKRSVMQLIEKYEQSKRGIFSGAVGYITPEKDFDFNVVIRSIMYNSANKYLSYQVGGGITFYSDAEKEYEECMLKASAIKQALG